MVHDYAVCRDGDDDEPPARLSRTRATRVIAELSPDDRCGSCGRVPVSRRGVDGEERLPLVEWHQSESGTVRASGLGWCADAWGCPDCWTAVAMHYAAVVTEALAGWQAGGRAAVMFTLTVPHRPSDPLRRLWDVKDGAWRWLRKRARWRHFEARWRVAHWCATTEANHSDAAGHHPHDHGLMFIDRPQLDELELDAFEAELTEMWAEALYAQEWLRALNRHHGVSVVPVDDVAEVGRYLFKRAGLEFAAPSGTKAGKGKASIASRDIPAWIAEQASGRSVAELAKADPLVRARADAWRTYRRAAAGRHAFRYSRAFYELTGTEAMGVAEIRRRTVKLRVEDRERVDKALEAAGVPPLPADDELDGQADDERAPVLAMSHEAYLEAQAAYERPDRRGSGAVVLPILRARRYGLAFHALVCRLVEQLGPELAAEAVRSSMLHPPKAYRDTRGTVVLAYYELDDEWTEVSWRRAGRDPD